MTIDTDASVGDVLQAVCGDGVECAWSPASFTLTVTGVASLAVYESTLRSVVFASVADAPATLQRRVSFTVFDGSVVSNVVTRAVVVTRASDVPNVSPPSATISQLTAQTFFVTPSVTDGEETTRFLFTDVAAGTLELFDSTPIASGSYVSVDAAARGVVFTPSGEVGVGGFSVAASGPATAPQLSAVVRVTVVVTAVTFKPQLNELEPYPAVFVEHSSGVLVSQAVVVADFGTGSLQSATVSITSGYIAGADRLVYPFPAVNAARRELALSIVASWNADTGVLTLTGASTPSVYQAALRSVAFRTAPPQQQPPPSGASGPRVVSLSVSDGAQTSDAVTRTIDVSLVNDPPVAPAGIAVFGVQDQPLTVELQGTDPDSPLFRARVTRFPQIGALFLFDAASSGPGAAMSASAADTDVDRRVVYVPPPGAFGFGLVSFAYVLFDDNSTSVASAVVTVSISSSSGAQLVGSDGRSLSTVTAPDGTLVVYEGESTRLGLRLPQSPGPGEVVSVECESAVLSEGTVQPSQLTFTAATYTAAQLLTLTGVRDGVNGDGTVRYSLVCTTVASSLGSAPVFAKAVVLVLAAETRDVVYPNFGDLQLLRGGVWTSSLAGDAFLATTSGGEVARLRADTRFHTRSGPTFLPGMVAYVGGVAVPVVVAADGLTAEFVTPSFETLCPGNGSCFGDAAFKSLRLVNPLVVNGSVVPVGLVGEVRGGEVSCPLECPGVQASPGIVYQQPCAGFAVGAVCLDPNTASSCGVESPDGTCTRCPSGGLCPAPGVLWPQNGNWAPSDASKRLFECRPPRHDRCRGWDAVARSTRCGDRYAAGSALCGACADGTFATPSGFCEKCAFDGSKSRQLLAIFGVGVGVAVVIVGMALLAQWNIGACCTAACAVSHCRMCSVCRCASVAACVVSVVRVDLTRVCTHCRCTCVGRVQAVGCRSCWCTARSRSCGCASRCSSRRWWRRRDSPAS